jgi:phage baseplate assembly protein W
MTKRTNPELLELWQRLGRDLELVWAGPVGAYDDADLAVSSPRPGVAHEADLGVVERVSAARQLLVNRLKTRKGELGPLGHPQYGSRHHEQIGEPNTERTRNLIKLHVLEAMRHEPRIAEVLRCDVTAADRPRDAVRIELDIRLIDEPSVVNLVVPFDLSGGVG